ncbi:acetoacetate--CoA ligase [Ensifer sp. NBAIM29]|nr:acetoacetate--CoA ligase [Ensifer sp. NBAIM29]
MNPLKPLWTPTSYALEHSPMAVFMTRCSERSGRVFDDYDDFHAWSVSNMPEFWSEVWDECDVIGERGTEVLVDGYDIRRARFFPGAKLNFAENLLRKRGPGPALIFRGEDRVSYSVTWDELHGLVSRLQQALGALGVGRGDRVVAMLPNLPETIALMLATSSLGAVWASCSPDFGVSGVLDRFAQVAPKLFVACGGYWYNGKKQDVGDKVREVAAGLAVPVVIVPYAGDAETLAVSVAGAVTLPRLIGDFQPRAVVFDRVPFSHPLYVLFSSGTTGAPKCIVHSVGGTLLQHLKEHRFHCGLGDGERLFYFTTCGWMMWNWLASGLALGATLCLYDGSPFYPGPGVLFDYAEQERFSVFGTSAKYIDAVRKSGCRPGETHDLSAMRLMASTGSPLSPEGFAFVYEAIKGDVQLASISGGTDIVSCFVLSNPLKPVWSGEIQGPGLGMAVDVWDDTGYPVRQRKGELVCTKAFPSMPIMFWNDPGGEKYGAAYFGRFDNVWCHGDFAEWTEHDGIVIHGRSDTTLNPGGVRIGTAEIYNQVERMDEVVEALCIGQEWDGDVRVVLFVRLAEGIHLDADLEQAIRTRIRTGASPRHVPAKILAVADIPRTKSGKIVELAVRETVHGRPVKNKDALANPEALSLYENLESLRA